MRNSSDPETTPRTRATNAGDETSSRIDRAEASSMSSTASDEKSPTIARNAALTSATSPTAVRIASGISGEAPMAHPATPPAKVNSACTCRSICP